MRSQRLFALVAAAAATALALTGCAGAGSGTAASTDTGIVVEHALGTTVVPAKPLRVATVQWENQEVPLALGIVPVGMAKAGFGDADGDGLLPWVKAKLDELGAETPVLFDETDGIDFEAVADTKPDVILAAYSGLTQQDYDTLSAIAPVVAYPDTAWATQWRDTIRLNSAGIGQADAGAALTASIEQQIAAETAKYPQLAGKKTMFLTHVDPADLSRVSFYSTHDPRAAFFADLGLGTPKAVADASSGDTEFSKTVSAEQADTFGDVDIIVTYGDAELISTLTNDPLLSKIPAVANGAIVALSGTSEVGTAANPFPLATSWVLADYVAQLASAADRAA